MNPMPTLVGHRHCTNIDLDFNEAAGLHDIPWYLLSPDNTVVRSTDRMETDLYAPYVSRPARIPYITAELNELSAPDVARGIDCVIGGDLGCSNLDLHTSSEVCDWLAKRATTGTDGVLEDFLHEAQAIKAQTKATRTKGACQLDAVAMVTAPAQAGSENVSVIWPRFKSVLTNQESGIGFRRGIRTYPNIRNFISAHPPEARDENRPMEGISAPPTSITRKGAEPSACA